MSKILCNEALKKFCKNGFLSPVKLMEEDEAQKIHLRLKNFEMCYPELLGHLDFKANLLCDWVDAVVRKNIILDVIEDLLGPNILNWNATFRIKENDGKSHAAWHQDSMYIKLKPNLTIVWLAVSPATIKSGCLKLIPGSHKGPLRQHIEGNDKNSILSRSQRIIEKIDTSKEFAAELKPGEACIFDHRIIHSSAPNTENYRRIGLLLDYLPTNAVKQGPRDSAMLVRGHDYFKHFFLESQPIGEATKENLEKQRHALKLITKTMYDGSSFMPQGLK